MISAMRKSIGRSAGTSKLRSAMIFCRPRQIGRDASSEQARLNEAILDFERGVRLIQIGVDLCQEKMKVAVPQTHGKVHGRE